MLQKKVLVKKGNIPRPRLKEVPKLAKLQAGDAQPLPNLQSNSDIKKLKSSIEKWAKTKGPLAKRGPEKDRIEKFVQTNKPVEIKTSNYDEPLNLSKKCFAEETTKVTFETSSDEELHDSGCGSSIKDTALQNISLASKNSTPVRPGSPSTSDDSDLEMTTEKICDIFKDLIESKSPVAQFVHIIPSIKTKSDDVSKEQILEELKKAFFKDKVPNEEAEPHEPSRGKNLSASTSLHSDLKCMGKTLEYVKTHLNEIKDEINNFKEHCWEKINRKVSKTEFRVVNESLNEKLNELENRVAMDQNILKQEVSKCRERIRKGEFSSNNVPVWPFIAFVGAYSLMLYGNKNY